MTPNARNRPYGWRARIGLIVPSPNTVNETEFWRMAPDGVTIHTARLLFEPEASDNPLKTMDAHLPRALRELKGAEVDIIAYGCTASSAQIGPDKVVAEIEAESGIPTVATAGSVLAALRALGARRIAFGTPYPEVMNRHERKFFAANGFEVTRDANLIRSEAQLRYRHMNLLPVEDVYEFTLGLDTPDTDAIFLSCTDMASLDVIDRAEAVLGKPVVTATQATFWQALRKAGIEDHRAGYGRLMAAH